MNAALKQAQERLQRRRADRQATDYHSPTTTRHEPLKLAYMVAGRNPNGGPTLYLLVRYCDACRRGTVVDLVREVPDGTPLARDLELRQQRPWRLECVRSEDE